MSESNQSTSSGINSCDLLGVVFITLKLCGVIEWSWWWVLVPFWGPLALALLVMLGVLVVWIFDS